MGLLPEPPTPDHLAGAWESLQAFLNYWGPRDLSGVLDVLNIMATIPGAG